MLDITLEKIFQMNSFAKWDQILQFFHTIIYVVLVHRNICILVERGHMYICWIGMHTMYSKSNTCKSVPQTNHGFFRRHFGSGCRLLKSSLSLSLLDCVLKIHQHRASQQVTNCTWDCRWTLGEASKDLTLDAYLEEMDPMLACVYHYCHVGNHWCWQGNIIPLL